MEALSSLVWHLADQKRFDIRIEAAIAKIFCSEKTIQFLKDAQIIFGGMGYETAASKRMRGEPAFIIEQLVRDAEMYRIGEGATDVLRPFVAREGLNPHLERTRAYLSQTVTGTRGAEFLKLLRFYVPWYAKQWRRQPLPSRPEFRHPKVRVKLLYVEQASRRLARAIVYAMARRREALRDDQGRQNRIEAVGEDLLVIASTALHAEAKQRLLRDPSAWDLADEFFRQAKTRIADNIRGLAHNDDQATTTLGKQALASKYSRLTEGMIQRSLNDYLKDKPGQ